MIAPTHIAFGLFFTLFGVTILGYTMDLTALAYVFGMLGAILPDIDTPRSIIGKLFLPISKLLDRKFGHRTVTHSFVGWGIASVLALPLFFWHKDYYAFFTLSYLSHLILDMANVQGITLLWPDRRRDVLGKIAMRLPAGDFKEIFLILAFVGLSILTLPLSHYGWKNSLGWLVGDHQSAEQVYLRSDKQSYLDFKGIHSVTRKPMEGKALILERYGVKGFIVGWYGKVITIGNTGDVDILSSQERINYTDQPEARKKVSLTGWTYDQLLQKIPITAYIKGEITFPTTYTIQIPEKLRKRISLNDHAITMVQTTLKELKTITVTRAENPEERRAQETITKAKQNFLKIKTDLYNDGYTDLGRKQLGIDHTKDQKYIDAQDTIKQAEQHLQAVLAQRSAERWTADLELR